MLVFHSFFSSVRLTGRMLLLVDVMKGLMCGWILGKNLFFFLSVCLSPSIPVLVVAAAAKRFLSLLFNTHLPARLSMD